MPDGNKRRDRRTDDKKPPSPTPKKAVQGDAPSPAAKRSAKDRKSRRALKKVGRTIRAGSASTLRTTRKAIGVFDTFTHASETDITQRSGLFRSIARFSARMTFPAFLLIAGLIIGLSVMAFTNSTVAVDRREIHIVGLPKELEGYTFLVLSDLHAREFSIQQRALLRTLDELSYNAVLFLGDMVGASGNAQPFYDLLEGLPANRPKFFIPGDSDPPALLKEPRGEDALENMVLSDWALGAQARGAKLLSYTQFISVNNQRIWLTPQSMLSINLFETVRLLEDQIQLERVGVMEGLESSRHNLPLTNYRYNAAVLTHEASSEMLASDVHIALTHIPPSQSFITTSQQRGEEETATYLPPVDLVLSGHYCGGIWRLPFIGALYIPNSLYPRHGWFPAKEDVQGEKPLGLSTQYTTAGLGVTDKTLLPNFRLLNPPQASLITLTAKISNSLAGE